MRLEYRLPWIKDSAISLNNGNWVTDKDFSESWEINPEFEMTIHPRTQEILHNPD